MQWRLDSLHRIAFEDCLRNIGIVLPEQDFNILFQTLEKNDSGFVNFDDFSFFIFIVQRNKKIETIRNMIITTLTEQGYVIPEVIYTHYQKKVINPEIL